MDSTATLPAAFSKLPLTAIATDATGLVVAGIIPTWSEGDGTVTLNDHGDGTADCERVGTAAGVATVEATFTNTVASPDGSFLTVQALIVVTVEAVSGTGGGSGPIVTDLEIVAGNPS